MIFERIAKKMTKQAFYLPITAQYFISTLREVALAEEQINYKLTSGNKVTLNDILAGFGLPAYGPLDGFELDYEEIRFETIETNGLYREIGSKQDDYVDPKVRKIVIIGIDKVQYRSKQINRYSVIESILDIILNKNSPIEKGV